MKPAQCRGVTLTEVMVATVIFTFIMAGLYVTLMAGRVSWQSYEAAIAAQRGVRNALSVMSRDLRVADNLSVTPVTDGLVTTFTHPELGSITYNWSTAGADANRIVRQTSTGSRIIANDVSALSISPGADDITITITADVSATGGHDNNFQLIKKIARRL